MRGILISTLIVICFFSSKSSEAKSETLTIGIVPQQSAKKLAKLWTPILKEISKRSEVKVHFKTAKDIPTFEKRVLKGDYDLAYMNPYHYTVFHKKPGYIAFAKRKNKKIQGIIVVANSSNIKNIKEFNGKTLVFPSPAAFAASIITRAYLKANGITIKPKYVSSHDSVYRNIEKGFAVAGGGIVRTLKSLDPEIRSKLKVFWKSPGYTPHAFAYHPKSSKDSVNKVIKAILSLDDDPKGKKLLERLKFSGIKPAKNSDWDDVRRLNIQDMKHFIEKK